MYTAYHPKTSPVRTLGNADIIRQFAAAKARVHDQRVLSELRTLGMSRYGINKMESRYLPKLIRPDEAVEGVAYGHSSEGSVMLVATDRRIIYLDRKPLFVKSEEVTYEVIGGVTVSHIGLATRLILHTRLGDYSLRTLNARCVKGFAEYVERRCLEHRNSSGEVWASYSGESDKSKGRK